MGVLGKIPAPCYAQQSFSSSATSADTTSKPATPGTRFDAGAADPFANLLRLNVTLSYKRPRIRVEDLLKELSESAGVKLRVEDTEIRFASVSCRCKDMAVRDILAMLAQVGAWEWKRGKDNALTLQPRFNARQYDVFRPRTEAQAQAQSATRAFYAQFARLPPETRQALQFDDPRSQRPRGAPFASLPPAVQQTLRESFEAGAQLDQERHFYTPLTSGDLNNANVFLSVRHQPDFEDIAVCFDGTTSEGGAAGTAVAAYVYHDPRHQNYEVLQQPAPNSYGSHPEREDAAARRDALHNDGRLQQKISLHTGKLAFNEALNELAARVLPLPAAPNASPDGAAPHSAASRSFCFAANARDPLPVRRALACDNMPLSDVLDMLCHLYAFDVNGIRFEYSWGVYKDAFVFHPVLITEPDNTAAK